MKQSPIPISALAPIIIIGLAFVGYCWYDILRSKNARYLPKWLWMFICVMSVPLGGIIYLLAGRDSDS